MLVPYYWNWFVLTCSSSFTFTFLVGSFESSIFLINRLPTPVLNKKNPLEVLFHKKPDYKFFKVFGCSCFPTSFLRFLGALVFLIFTHTILKSFNSGLQNMFFLVIVYFTKALGVYISLEEFTLLEVFALINKSFPIYPNFLLMLLLIFTLIFLLIIFIFQLCQYLLLNLLVQYLLLFLKFKLVMFLLILF